ncbi:YxiF family protein [Bacillus aerius]
MNVDEVFHHLTKLLEHIKFSSGYGEFILIAGNFHFG